MADAPVILLLQQIVQDAELWVEVLVDVHFADVVEQVEIKVFHTGFA